MIYHEKIDKMQIVEVLVALSADIRKAQNSHGKNIFGHRRCTHELG
jgi:hypothetical protein